MSLIIKETKSESDHKCCLCGETLKAGRSHIHVSYWKDGFGIESRYHLFKICQIDKGKRS